MATYRLQTRDGAKRRGRWFRIVLSTLILMALVAPALPMVWAAPGDVDLTLNVADGDLSAAWYTEFDYTLTISNPVSAGTNDIAHDVSVVDQLDSFLDYVGLVSISDPNALGRTCAYDAGTHQVSCDLKDMFPGETVTVVFTVLVMYNAPTTANCEIDTNGANTSAAPCGGCATGYDMCNTASVTTTSFDINTANNSDDEPKDITLPTSVDLLSFTARGLDDGVVLRWVTASETDSAGYNLYRARWPKGPQTKINPELIPTLVAPGSLEGALYRYFNWGLKDDTVYYYWLEAVDLYGGSTLYGPIGVRTK